MGQALLATWRVLQHYSVSGVDHTLHLYAKGVVAGGSDHTLHTRNSTDINFQDVATNLKNEIGALFGAGISWGSTELQQLTTGRWLTQRVWTVTAPAGSGTAKLGSQVTITLRSSTILPVKVIMLDTNEQPPFRYIDPAGGDANLDGVIAAFMPKETPVAEDPYNWMVSRENQYLSTSPFVSVSADINRKVKKAHGL